MSLASFLLYSPYHYPRSICICFNLDEWACSIGGVEALERGSLVLLIDRFIYLFISASYINLAIVYGADLSYVVLYFYVECHWPKFVSLQILFLSLV